MAEDYNSSAFRFLSKSSCMRPTSSLSTACIHNKLTCFFDSKFICTDSFFSSSCALSKCCCILPDGLFVSMNFSWMAVAVRSCLWNGCYASAVARGASSFVEPVWRSSLLQRDVSSMSRFAYDYKEGRTNEIVAFNWHPTISKRFWHELNHFLRSAVWVLSTLEHRTLEHRTLEYRTFQDWTLNLRTLDLRRIIPRTLLRSLNVRTFVDLDKFLGSLVSRCNCETPRTRLYKRPGWRASWLRSMQEQICSCCLNNMNKFVHVV